MADGDFALVFTEDCVKRDFAPGPALVDPGDTVHAAFNPNADEETVIVATLFGVPAEGRLTTPANPDRGAVLDEQCGIERLSG